MSQGHDNALPIQDYRTHKRVVIIEHVIIVK
jgi:hypothetical protein